MTIVFICTTEHMWSKHIPKFLHAEIYALLCHGLLSIDWLVEILLRCIVQTSCPAWTCSSCWTDRSCWYVWLTYLYVSMVVFDILYANYSCQRLLLTCRWIKWLSTLLPLELCIQGFEQIYKTARTHYIGVHQPVDQAGFHILYKKIISHNKDQNSFRHRQ